MLTSKELARVVVTGLYLANDPEGPIEAKGSGEVMIPVVRFTANFLVDVWWTNSKDVDVRAMLNAA
jgi:hypothetical protein